MHVISKKDFTEVIESMKKIDDYHAEKRKLYKKYGADGFIIEPDNNHAVLLLLKWIFRDTGADTGAISAFCLNNNYGTGKGNQEYIDTDGHKNKISTIDDLYDYLTKNNMEPAKDTSSDQQSEDGE